MKEINAEMLLGYLYPETDWKWNVNCRGTFYRNYNDDCLSFDPDERILDLARDGFLKSLPGALFLDSGDSDENGEEKEFRVALVREAFAPFDSFDFAHGMALERAVASLLADKYDFILKTYFDFDLEKEEDPLVRQAAMMLPIIRRRRGSPQMVKLVLSSLLHCDVEVDTGHRECSGNPGQWLPKITCTLLIPGLSPEGLRAKVKELEPLSAFIRDRFVPFDVAFELRIRDCAMPQGAGPGQPQALDYNCQIS